MKMFFLKDFCYLCLSYNKEATSRNIIGPNAQEVLECIVPDYVSQKPDIPKLICDDCSNTLKSISKFRQRCLESVNTFNKYVQTLSEENYSFQNLSVRVTDILYDKQWEMLKNALNSTEKVEVEIDCDIESDDEIYVPDHHKSVTENGNEEAIEQVIIKSEIPSEEFYAENEINEVAVKQEPVEDLSSLDNMRQCYNTNEYKDTQATVEIEPDEYGLRNKISSNAANNSGTSTEGGQNVFYIQQFKCYVCDEIFSHRSDLEKHSCNNIGKRSYECHTCHKVFAQPTHLRIHKRIHSGERPYTCAICAKTFRCPSNYSVHKRVHTGEKPYTCDVCQKSFTFLSNLNAHKQTHSDEKQFSCDICSRTFTFAHNLKVHKRTHTGEKPFECDGCDKSFASLGYLNKHKRIHTGNKPYSCEVCQKTFTFLSNLNAHKHIHSGEKTFQCDVCQKLFFTAGILRTHQRHHEADKAYKCDECTKSFVSRSKLTAHQRVHTGTKP